MKHSYEFHGFTIVESSCSWFVYGSCGLIGKFDTSKDAEDFIFEIL